MLLVKGRTSSVTEDLCWTTLPTSLSFFKSPCVCIDDTCWGLAAPVLHLPAAAALKTHAVTWAANMVVQEAMPSAYYDHDVTTLGIFSLQHNGRQHGRTDGVCFNSLVALTPDYVQLNEDGEKMDATETGQPPPVENLQYIWHQVQKEPLREKLLEKIRSMSILPIHSLY